MTTILCELEEHTVHEARPDAVHLWLNAADTERVTGWTFKPEGLCKGEVCVPLLPEARERLESTGLVDLAALWRHLGKPVVHSDDGRAWSLGEAAEVRGAALRSLDAPDFELPDSKGRPHRLSHYRGRKVLLVTWASW